MNESDLFEQNDHVFTGTITSWQEPYGELVTDSGVVVRFVSDSSSGIVNGKRISITAKKFRPCYKVERLTVIG